MFRLHDLRDLYSYEKSYPSYLICKTEMSRAIKNMTFHIAYFGIIRLKISAEME